MRNRSQAAEIELDVRLASTMSLRLQALRLIYDRYLGAGLIAPNVYQLRVTPFHLLPTTSMFVGQSDVGVVSTVTLVADGRLGLPIDSCYRRELAELRAAGISLAEVSCLAFEDTSSPAFWGNFLALNRLLAHYARFHGIDALVIAVHPRHARVYQRLMGFKQIGAVKQYPSVRDNPAVACCLEFSAADREQPACYEAIFGQPIPTHMLRKPAPPSATDRLILAAVARRAAASCLPIALG